MHWGKESITGATVVLDIDGTLMPSDALAVNEEGVAAVRTLASHNEVYLFSNKRKPVRNAAIAAQLKVPLIVAPYRKPDPRVLHAVPKDRELVVIGDKVLTDGLLAALSGARFIYAKRLTSARESFADRAFNAIDDVARYAWSYIRLMRPVQWAKNGLIFAPLFFGHRILDEQATMATAATFIAFCAIASATYIINDLYDLPLDREHPRKRNRPLARGDVTPTTALVLCGTLLVLGGMLLYRLVPEVLLIAVIYGVSSVIYSAYLKRVAIIEMLLFIWFYLARILAGGIAAEVLLSSWLTLSVIFLALFIIVGKRTAEHEAGRTRGVLSQYSTTFLHNLLILSAALIVAFYGVWCVLGAPSSIALYSIVPVLGGVMRYMQLISKDSAAEYPETLVFKDPGIRIAAVLWLVSMLAVFY